MFAYLELLRKPSQHNTIQYIYGHYVTYDNGLNRCQGCIVQTVTADNHS